MTRDHSFYIMSAMRAEDSARSPQFHILRRRMGQSYLVTWRNPRQEQIRWRLNYPIR